MLLIGLAPVPVVAYLSKLLLDFRTRREETSRRVAEASTTITSDVISNIKTVRGFAMETGEIEKYRRSTAMQVRSGPLSSGQNQARSDQARPGARSDQAWPGQLSSGQV